jgi:hypothetical protein
VIVLVFAVVEPTFLLLVLVWVEMGEMCLRGVLSGGRPVSGELVQIMGISVLVLDGFVVGVGYSLGRLVAGGGEVEHCWLKMQN